MNHSAVPHTAAFADAMLGFLDPPHRIGGLASCGEVTIELYEPHAAEEDWFCTLLLIRVVGGRYRERAGIATIDDQGVAVSLALSEAREYHAAATKLPRAIMKLVNDRIQQRSMELHSIRSFDSPVLHVSSLLDHSPFLRRRDAAMNHHAH